MTLKITPLLFVLFCFNGAFAQLKAEANKDGLVGYKNDSGKLVIDYQYQKGKDFYEEAAIVKKDSYWGLINEKNELIQYGFTSIELKGIYNNHYFATDSSYLMGILDLKGQWIYEPQFEMWEVWYNDHNILPVQGPNGFGIISLYGDPIIEPKYEIEDFYTAVNADGEAYYGADDWFVLGYGGRWGVISGSGKELVPFEYDYIRVAGWNRKNSFAGVEKNGKIALMDPSANVITDFVFDAYYGVSLDKDFLALRKGDAIVYRKISDGTEHSKLDSGEYEWQKRANSQIVSYRGKYGVIGKNGDIRIPFEYDRLQSATGSKYESIEMPLQFKKDSLVGIMQNMKTILPARFDHIYHEGYEFNVPIYIARSEGKIQLFKTDGELYIETVFDEFLPPFRQGNDTSEIKVRVGEEWCRINKDGSLIKE